MMICICAVCAAETDTDYYDEYASQKINSKITYVTLVGEEEAELSCGLMRISLIPYSYQHYGANKTEKKILSDYGFGAKLGLFHRFNRGFTAGLEVGAMLGMLEKDRENAINIPGVLKLGYYSRTDRAFRYFFFFNAGGKGLIYTRDGETRRNINPLGGIEVGFALKLKENLSIDFSIEGLASYSEKGEGDAKVMYTDLYGNGNIGFTFVF